MLKRREFLSGAAAGVSLLPGAGPRPALISAQALPFRRTPQGGVEVALARVPVQEVVCF